MLVPEKIAHSASNALGLAKNGLVDGEFIQLIVLIFASCYFSR
jgi:hypothetical protein